MAAFINPALAAFATRLVGEMVVAQVLIRRVPAGFELRHVQDRQAEPPPLQLAAPEALRALAQFTADGRFRPLKSAPNLPAGWRCVARGESELELALNHLYPGAVADWFAAQSPQPPVTNFRAFADRQTGIYESVAGLSDGQAAQTVQTTCHENACLKRRLWTGPGLEPDPPELKSLIPCLEPCAVWLESARLALSK